MIKAVIIGVSAYADPHNNLPKCLNDIYAIRQALIVGLNAKADNIYLYGENQTVYINDFYLAFNEIIKQINNTDTFIFYFSGHGYKQNNNNYLAFSDGFLSIEAIIRDIDNISCKNKIVIIDSCHSGNKDVYLQSKIDINETADQFVGHGCAIMASCDLEEYSGFDPDVDLSLYTRILCEALTARSIIKQGKKSLEDIKTYVDRLVNIANQKSNTPQHNAFRSNILGTIFFDIEKFLPYQTQHIYKETDKYIIYSVEPSHANVKRISMTVILRFPCSPEELAVIANEITNEAIHYEVYDTKQSEWRFKGLPNNIIFTYYGYDENDVINHNYAYRTIWVDENQDKSNWYRSDDKSSVIDDIWVCTINSYDFMKKFISENTADNDQLITSTRNCMYKMIMEAEKFLCQYREYLNKTITEQELITNTKIILEEIRNLYFEQSDFPIATNELRNWQTAFSNLASVIDDFVVCYDANSIKNRDSRNRMQLVELTIKRYNQSLEKIKSVDITLAQQLKETGDTNE